MWDRIPVWTGPESVQKGTVAYQVLKVEMSIFSALALSPGGVSHNHMTDFLKNGADAKSSKQHSTHELWA